jgi:hypothetical protein
MLFALPAAIAAPIIAGILLGGPMLGFPVAAVVAILIVAVAIRMEPREWRRARRPGSARLGGPGAPYDAADRGWRRTAARRFLMPVAVAVAGSVLIAAWAGVARIIGWGIVGVAITIALSLVFLEVGYSEDRARAREQRAGGAWRRGGGGHRPVH